MNIEQIRDFCLSKEGVNESFPFNESTLVFKVYGKMFALLSLEVPHSINLKCDPEEAIILRETYEFVIPGYHMNKTHWNTIQLSEEVSFAMLRTWIEHSYELILRGIPVSKRRL